MYLKCTTTTYQKNKRQVAIKEVAFVPDTGIENEAVNLHPEIENHVFDGFGGAFTDATGYVYAQMNDEQKEDLVRTFYDRGEMNYQFGRVHLDSCDFSTSQYEAMSDPDDREMKSFSLDRMKENALPLLADVQKYTGKKLELLASPWSPPAFMKNNKERVHGGHLLKEYYEFWADYICKYIVELAKEDCHISSLTLQNEAKAWQVWDSCEYTVEEEKQFLKAMYASLCAHDLKHIGIYIWDHNKERLYERACGIIDDETDKMVEGLAFHWYSGDHFESLDLVRRKFPDKKLIMSEGAYQFTPYGSKTNFKNAQKYAHDLIGNLNHGMSAFYDWNFVLDEIGGPNHVGYYCEAPYEYDTKKKKLKERRCLHYLWHFSHFIEPGAVSIGFSRYAEAVDMTAFKNPDGKIVGVVMNTTKKKLPIVFRLLGCEATIVLDKKSITTFEIAM